MLLQDDDILVWYYLRLSSFEFIQDRNLNNEDLQTIVLSVQLPAGYKKIELHQVPNRLNGLQEANEGSFARIKTLLFTGDFTGFVQRLLGCSEEYLIDSVYITVILNQLGLLKTRFQMAKLLYIPQTK